MRRLQMGMWNYYDKAGWDKYHLDKINGIECGFADDPDQLGQLMQHCKREQITFGIHSKSYPHFITFSEEKWEQTKELVRKEVRIAADSGADYLLYHYPFPPIYPDQKEPRYWPGYPEHDFLESNQLTRTQFWQMSHQVMQYLTELSHTYSQRIVLEYDFFGEFEDIFIAMFHDYKQIQLVVDTQRVDIHKRAFPSFDPYEWMRQVSPYVYLVHYSNTRYGEEMIRHIPVLKEHADLDEYGDSYQYLCFLSERNKHFHLTFEHNPQHVSEKELLLCYEQVEALISPTDENGGKALVTHNLPKNL